MGRRGEGGSRGGYWTNARKAFQFATIARVKPGPHTAEFFYLDKDELTESDSDTRLWGANYELSDGKDSTIGATYMKFMADPGMRPERDGLNVFNLRTYTAPIRRYRTIGRVRVRLGAQRRRAATRTPGRCKGRIS